MVIIYQYQRIIFLLTSYSKIILEAYYILNELYSIDMTTSNNNVMLSSFLIMFPSIILLFEFYKKITENRNI